MSKILSSIIIFVLIVLMTVVSLSLTSVTPQGSTNIKTAHATELDCNLLNPDPLDEYEEYFQFNDNSCLKYKVVPGTTDNDSESIEIVGSFGSLPSTFIIPEQIANLPVEKISQKAFYHNEQISTVVFPKTLKSIGYQAFMGDGDIKQIRRVIWTSLVEPKFLDDEGNVTYNYSMADVFGFHWDGNFYEYIPENSNYTIMRTWHQQYDDVAIEFYSLDHKFSTKFLLDEKPWGVSDYNIELYRTGLAGSDQFSKNMIWHSPNIYSVDITENLVDGEYKIKSNGQDTNYTCILFYDDQAVCDDIKYTSLKIYDSLGNFLNSVDPQIQGSQFYIPPINSLNNPLPKYRAGQRSAGKYDCYSVVDSEISQVIDGGIFQSFDLDYNNGIKCYIVAQNDTTDYIPEDLDNNQEYVVTFDENDNNAMINGDYINRFNPEKGILFKINSNTVENISIVVDGEHQNINKGKLNIVFEHNDSSVTINGYKNMPNIPNQHNYNYTSPLSFINGANVSVNLDSNGSNNNRIGISSRNNLSPAIEVSEKETVADLYVNNSFFSNNLDNTPEAAVIGGKANLSDEDYQSGTVNMFYGGGSSILASVVTTSSDVSYSFGAGIGGGANLGSGNYTVGNINVISDNSQFSIFSLAEYGGSDSQDKLYTHGAGIGGGMNRSTGKYSVGNININLSKQSSGLVYGLYSENEQIKDSFGAGIGGGQQIALGNKSEYSVGNINIDTEDNSTLSCSSRLGKGAGIGGGMNTYAESDTNYIIDPLATKVVDSPMWLNEKYTVGNIILDSKTNGQIDASAAYSGNSFAAGIGGGDNNIDGATYSVGNIFIKGNVSVTSASNTNKNKVTNDTDPEYIAGGAGIGGGTNEGFANYSVGEIMIDTTGKVNAFSALSTNSQNTPIDLESNYSNIQAYGAGIGAGYQYGVCPNYDRGGQNIGNICSKMSYKIGKISILNGLNQAYSSIGSRQNAYGAGIGGGAHRKEDSTNSQKIPVSIDDILVSSNKRNTDYLISSHHCDLQDCKSFANATMYGAGYGAGIGAGSYIKEGNYNYHEIDTPASSVKINSYSSLISGSTKYSNKNYDIHANKIILDNGVIWLKNISTRAIPLNVNPVNDNGKLVYPNYLTGDSYYATFSEVDNYVNSQDLGFMNITVDNKNEVNVNMARSYNLCRKINFRTCFMEPSIESIETYKQFWLPKGQYTTQKINFSDEWRISDNSHIFDNQHIFSNDKYYSDIQAEEAQTNLLLWEKYDIEICRDGQHSDNGLCVDDDSPLPSECLNGATNPPDCNSFPGSQPCNPPLTGTKPNCKEPSKPIDIYTSSTPKVASVDSKTGKITDRRVGKTTITKKTYLDGKLTSTKNTKYKVTLTKKFKVSFTDLKTINKKTNPTRAASIKWLGEKGIAKCVDKNGKNISKCAYNPKNPVNRGAMSEFLWKLIKTPDIILSGKQKDQPKHTKESFLGEKDMKALKTSKKASEQIRYWAINYLINDGVLTKSGKSYLPKSSVDRSIMAAWMFNLAVQSGVVKKDYKPNTFIFSKKFKDVNLKTPNHNAIWWLAEQEITLGTKTPAGLYYKPKDAVNRGSMAEFLQKLYNYIIR